MKKSLQISPNLSLPIDTVTSTIIAYGGKGMGKTVFGAVLAEELAVCGLRWAWLDPLGVGYGIRHAADGKGLGVECLVLGGVHGDIPIDPSSGAAVADVVIEESCNVLIDFSRKPSGEMWGVGEKIRFVTAYARRLFQRQGSLVDGRRREPLFQILDEGARYIPQTIPAGNPDLAMCVSAWQQFVEEGRNVGLGLLVLTQRSARINKDVAELADAMFAFRTVGPHSLDAVIDWLGTHVARDRAKALAEQVRKLPRGTALVVSPGWLETEKVVAIRMRRTFDSSATPKPGERAKAARGPGAKPNLEKIRARMTENIERAKADDPKVLRAEIVELKKEIAKKSPAAKVEEVRVPMTDPETIAAIENISPAIEQAHMALKHLSGALAGAEALVKAAKARACKTLNSQLIARTRGRPLENSTSGPLPLPVRAKSATTTFDQRRAYPHGKHNGTSTASLPKGERAIMIAIAQHPNGVTREQLTVLTGYKRSTRDAYLQRLSTSGHVDASNGMIEATIDGRNALGSDYQPLPTGHALLEHWLGRLPEGERKILEVTAGEFPEAVSRDWLGEATGYKRSTRDAYLQRLGTRKLVKVEHDGIRLSEELVG